jgi:hypothetical protein
LSLTLRTTGGREVDVPPTPLFSTL